ncbi:hypothetical protein MRB53_025852 [Persea americana]|uniref:Uncharacterized protein n=1 Tax=Persea americana TaxID=3435 RepID=A0ACC2LGD4_PERAE|nr:hypothetical protein MRB53_025852 [Persea americana]
MPETKEEHRRCVSLSRRRARNRRLPNGVSAVTKPEFPLPSSRRLSPDSSPPFPEKKRYLRCTELVEPALAGTQNVLRACSEAGVERLIAVSSIAAVALNPNWPQDRPMDENSWTDIDYCKSRQSKDFFNSTVIDMM